jgi:dolichol-phosphate mannosyltransferase
MSNMIIGSNLSDPMSGYFMLPRDLFIACSRALSGNGYKILFDLLASSPGQLRTKEVPYCFRPRVSGESKLDMGVMVEHLALLISKSIGRNIPMELLTTAASLLGSLALHFIFLAALIVRLEFHAAQAIAAVSVLLIGHVTLAMLDRRKIDRGALPGILLNLLTTTTGLVANLTLANYLFDQTGNWWLAGSAGAVLAAAWKCMSRPMRSMAI